MLSDTVGYGKDEISSSDSGSPGAGFSPIETPIVKKNICTKKYIFGLSVWKSCENCVLLLTDLNHLIIQKLFFSYFVKCL